MKYRIKFDGSFWDMETQYPKLRQFLLLKEVKLIDGFSENKKYTNIGYDNYISLTKKELIALNSLCYIIITLNKKEFILNFDNRLGFELR